MGRATIWFDTGTFESLYEASSFIKSVENNSDLKLDVQKNFLEKGMDK